MKKPNLIFKIISKNSQEFIITYPEDKSFIVYHDETKLKSELLPAQYKFLVVILAKSYTPNRIAETGVLQEHRDDFKGFHNASSTVKWCGQQLSGLNKIFEKNRADIICSYDKRRRLIKEGSTLAKIGYELCKDAHIDVFFDAPSREPERSQFLSQPQNWPDMSDNKFKQDGNEQGSNPPEIKYSHYQDAEYFLSTMHWYEEQDISSVEDAEGYLESIADEIRTFVYILSSGVSDNEVNYLKDVIKKAKKSLENICNKFRQSGFEKGYKGRVLNDLRRKLVLLGEKVDTKELIQNLLRQIEEQITKVQEEIKEEKGRQYRYLSDASHNGSTTEGTPMQEVVYSENPMQTASSENINHNENVTYARGEHNNNTNTQATRDEQQVYIRRRKI